MRFETTGGKSSTAEGQKIQPLDLTKSQSQELKKQQGSFKPENHVVSQKLDSISPSMRRTYEWVLRQKTPTLTSKALEEAIWKLHKYRQEKDSNPDKTAVAPDKSGTQTLTGQISHWSSSDTLVSPVVQTPMLLDHTNQGREKQLGESLRSIAKEYRQQGISRSTAPDLRNMTESQFLLEVLSKPDWSNKLQEKGIGVNKPTLQLISQKLKRIDPSDLLDYNTAVRNFRKTVLDWKRDMHKDLQKDDLKGYERLLRDTEQLLVETAGLRGGIFHVYDANGQPYARFMTLRDPSGTEHVFNKGEESIQIADFTARWIMDHRREYDVSCHLTKDNVDVLKAGKILEGWTCTELRYISVEQRVYRTDKGTLIYALHNLPYEACPKEDDDKLFPGMPHIDVENPTAAYNCYSLMFLNKNGWLVHEGGNVMRTILGENGYWPINRKDAQIGDIAVYSRAGAIKHVALVIAIEGNNITVDSKLGSQGRKYHEMSAYQVVVPYGYPTIYHTDREAGHTLLRAIDDTNS